MDLYLTIGIAYLSAAALNYFVNHSVEHAAFEAYIGTCYLLSIASVAH